MILDGLHTALVGYFKSFGGLVIQLIDQGNLRTYTFIYPVQIIKPFTCLKMGFSFDWELTNPRNPKP